MPGAHNVLNALGVLAVADFLGDPVRRRTSRRSRSSRASQRRFTVRGEVGGVTVVDDFGHHPAEVRATLAGARAGFPAAASSPRSSRTATRARAICSSEFARAFNDADVVVICDIYAAGEKPIAGVDVGDAGQGDARRTATRTSRYVRAPRGRRAAGSRQQAQPGDLVITLGAGNIQLDVQRGHRAARGRASGRQEPGAR